MRNKLLVMFLLAITSVVLLPSEASAGTSDSRNASNSSFTTELTQTETLSQRRRRGGYWENRRNGRRVYRNYGQYRRMQNRRTRLVRQTYYRNGRRYVRTVRVYY